MSSDMVSLPEEIVEALSRRGGFSLLVKGDPGSGKTIFALSVCNAFSKSYECFYVTSRSTADEIKRYYPIVEKFFDERRVIDATESKAEVKLETAISLRMYDKPSFLQRLYSIIHSTIGAEKRAPLVVVDSLEALKESMKLARDDSSLEDALIDIARETEGKILFVSESAEKSFLDYLVDGIVTLRKEEDNGHLLRFIKIEKLRGIKVVRPTYLFTLEGGIFNATRFEAFSMTQKIIQSNEKFELIYREPTIKGRVSTGIRQLDELIGGYIKGSLNLIEVAKGVGEFHDYFYLPTVINHVISGGKVVIIPPGGLSASFIRHVLTRILPEASVRNNITIVKYMYGEESDTTMLKGKNLLEDAEFFFRQLGEEGLIVFGMDTLQHVYGLDELKRSLGRLVARIKHDKIVAVGIVKYGQEIIDLLNHLADTHLMVKNVNGNIIAYGIIPCTPALYPHLAKGRILEVNLTAII
ncbi:MAG: gas vesicle protein GvpD P-loop domain-containing protein [Candidatus Jordarchaeales archaeon]